MTAMTSTPRIAVTGMLPGVWREVGGLDGLVLLDVPATTRGMMVVAKIGEPWQTKPQLRWQVWPDDLEPAAVPANSSARAAAVPHARLTAAIERAARVEWSMAMIDAQEMRRPYSWSAGSSVGRTRNMRA